MSSLYPKSVLPHKAVIVFSCWGTLLCLRELELELDVWLRVESLTVIEQGEEKSLFSKADETKNHLFMLLGSDRVTEHELSLEYLVRWVLQRDFRQ